MHTAVSPVPQGGLAPDLIKHLHHKNVISDQLMTQLALNDIQTRDWVLWLIEEHQINPFVLRDFFADYFAQPKLDISQQTSDCVLRQYWQTHPIVQPTSCLPVAETASGICVAVANPNHLSCLETLANTWRRPCLPMWTDALSLKHLNQTLAPPQQPSFTTSTASQWLTLLFEKAQRLQATDIHLETKQQQFILILLRIDGVVGPLKMPEHIGAQQCVSRLKVLANLDITKQTQPQEGYFAHTLATSQTQHIRVSCLPTKQGEKIALRLLTMGTLTQEHTFLALGMSAAMAKTIEDHLRAPQGLFLVTGPTGSGKTQTLYQCLKQLQRQPRLLYSIEDPVESELDGVTQIEVNSDTDFNFASAFKALLRQDPDVIMIGEIRDAQTAKLVFQAAQTGHLILASLHTQDTTSALIRLHQLGISALEMATTLSIVIAQRLIRTFCQHCLGQGCYACIDGYLGRTALFEVSQWPMGTTCFSLEELLSISKKHCHQSLMQHGLEKVQSKLTSLSEVHRLFPIEHS